MTVSTSAEVLPEIFEHERFSTTVANAVLSPLICGYVERLQDRLTENGYDGDVLLLHSGGGVMTPKLAQRFAVRLAASGIAAGAIASRHIATLCGYQNAIGFDMGGTSTDVSLVYEGEERRDEGVVRRVRLPDLLPVDRGADDRRRRRLVRLDRRGRLSSQRSSVGRGESRAGVLRARE